MRTLSLTILALVLSILFGAPAFAKEGDTAANINIVFVTDLSGSMKTNNLIDPTRSFLHQFVAELYVGDRVVMANFGTDIVVNNPMNISERNKANDVAQLDVVIDGYQFTENFTYTSGALLAACEALKRQSGPAVLVLLSDGKEEIPPGSDAKWDQLSSACSGNAIHVVALTAASKPTLDRVGKQLGATVHDATKKSLAEIGNDIRAGIRVFVTADKQSFELGNLTVGEAAETRATFSLTGASQQVELKPVGDFPAGANFSCQNFSVPGDMSCSVVLMDTLQPGSYSGKIVFTPVQGNLAVVTPIVEVKFSRGMTQVTASENDISLGAMRPGESQVISIDFEAKGSASPQPITVSLSGFPDGMVTLEQSEIMAPASDVTLKFTFNGGNPGSYSGQLVLTSTSPTMQVQPAALPVSFHRRTWYWENWKLTLPVTAFLSLAIVALYIRKVVVPRRHERTKPLLSGQIVYVDGRTVSLNGETQEIDGFTFRATGTREDTQIVLIASSNVRVKRQRGGNISLIANVEHTLKHSDSISTRSGELLFTFHCIGL